MNITKIGKGMGRKPVHNNGSKKSGQDAIWKAVRTLKTFERNDITCWVSRYEYQSVSDATVRSYLKRLQLGGFIEISKIEKMSGCAERYTFELIKDCGVHAPRINKKGQIVTQGQGRQNLWRSMKILNTFSWRELVAASQTEDISIAASEAKRYVTKLHQAGYLALVAQSNTRKGCVAQYRFIKSKDTGPLPPQIQRSKAVFDPNLNQVVWSPEDQVEKETQHA